MNYAFAIDPQLVRTSLLRMTMNVGNLDAIILDNDEGAQSGICLSCAFAIDPQLVRASLLRMTINVGNFDSVILDSDE